MNSARDTDKKKKNKTKRKPKENNFYPNATVVRFDVLCYAGGLTFLKDLAAILQEVQGKTKIAGGLFPHSC